MTLRVDLVKSELNVIYNMLNESFEYVNIVRLKNDNRFKKIIEILMEIKEESDLLHKAIKGNSFF